MDSAIISALAGVLGSLVGGSATIATAWVTQRTLSARELIRVEIRKREALYGQFIEECSKLAFDAFVHTLEKPEPLLPAYALLNRIRLSASRSVLGEAEKMLARIAQQYSAPNLSPQELHALGQSGETDPLKPFGEACRAELKSMRSQGEIGLISGGDAFR
jgi:hypothetical protein